MATSFRSDKNIRLETLFVFVLQISVWNAIADFSYYKSNKTFGSLLQCKQTHHFIFMSHVIKWSHMETWKCCTCTCVSVCPDYPSYCASINETVTYRDSRSYATPVQSFPNLFWQRPAFHSLMQLKHHYPYIVCWIMIIIGVALFGLFFAQGTNLFMQD